MTKHKVWRLAFTQLNAHSIHYCHFFFFFHAFLRCRKPFKFFSSSVLPSRAVKEE